MDPINLNSKLNLGSQLSFQREDNSVDRRKRKPESGDPEEPGKKVPSQQILEDSNTVKRSSERKCEDSEEGEHVKRIKLSPSKEEECEDSSSNKKWTSGKLSQSPIHNSSKTSSEGTSDALVTSLKTSEQNSKVEFEIKYTQEKQISHGAHGSVFAGYRNTDSLPVAIKYIPHKKVKYTQHGKEGCVPLEVALLLSLKDVAAVITLLDWYDLGSKVVLVMERPEQCFDLFDYVCSKGGLEEPSMKIIMKQLVDAFVEIHSRGVLHRDLHSRNVLIELGSTASLVRIIDFGCGSFVKAGKNKEPMTICQIGLVLHEMLQFSPNCIVTEDFKDFLSACLIVDPTAESSLQGLQCHPWLNRETRPGPKPTAHGLKFSQCRRSRRD